MSCFACLRREFAGILMDFAIICLLFRLERWLSFFVLPDLYSVLCKAGNALALFI